MTDKEIYSIEASPEQNISIDLGSFVLQYVPWKW